MPSAVAYAVASAAALALAASAPSTAAHEASADADGHEVGAEPGKGLVEASLLGLCVSPACVVPAALAPVGGFGGFGDFFGGFFGDGVPPPLLAPWPSATLRSCSE